MFQEVIYNKIFIQIHHKCVYRYSLRVETDSRIFNEEFKRFIEISPRAPNNKENNFINRYTKKLD